MRLPLLILHISAGTLGYCLDLLRSFSTSSRQHGFTGNVFVISMLSMSASAVCLAFMKSQTGNVLGGVFTFYLVTTAWLTAKRREGETQAPACLAQLFRLYPVCFPPDSGYRLKSSAALPI